MPSLNPKPRWVAALLCLALVLTSTAEYRLWEMVPLPLAAAMPSPAYALRPELDHAGVEQALNPAAGTEEIKADASLPVIRKLLKQAQQRLSASGGRRTVYVVIDGDKGAGKSMFSSYLQSSLGVPVIHIDDYVDHDADVKDWNRLEEAIHKAEESGPEVLLIEGYKILDADGRAGVPFDVKIKLVADESTRRFNIEERIRRRRSVYTDTDISKEMIVRADYRRPPHYDLIIESSIGNRPEYVEVFLQRIVRDQGFLGERAVRVMVLQLLRAILSEIQSKFSQRLVPLDLEGEGKLWAIWKRDLLQVEIGGFRRTVSIDEFGDNQDKQAAYLNSFLTLYRMLLDHRHRVQIDFQKIFTPIEKLLSPSLLPEQLNPTALTVAREILERIDYELAQPDGPAAGTEEWKSVWAVFRDLLAEMEKARGRSSPLMEVEVRRQTLEVEGLPDDYRGYHTASAEGAKAVIQLIQNDLGKTGLGLKWSTRNIGTGVYLEAPEGIEGKVEWEGDLLVITLRPRETAAGTEETVQERVNKLLISIAMMTEEDRQKALAELRQIGPEARDPLIEALKERPTLERANWIQPTGAAIALKNIAPSLSADEKLRAVSGLREILSIEELRRLRKMDPKMERHPHTWLSWVLPAAIRALQTLDPKAAKDALFKLEHAMAREHGPLAAVVDKALENAPAAGTEELTVEQRLGAVAEAMPGGQALAVQDSVFGGRPGLKKFLSRLSQQAGLETVVLEGNNPVDWGVALAGLERVLLDLGLSPDLLEQINAAGVEQRLASDRSA